jgi:ubiquitin carboxyl-terminal hydrolase 34
MKIVYCNEFKQRSQTGFVGLKNLGNTCYINSMIQQMFMNRNFRYSILRADDNNK